MIVTLARHATESDLANVALLVANAGGKVHLRRNEAGLSLVAFGAKKDGDLPLLLKSMPEVASVIEHEDAFQLVSRKSRRTRSQVRIGDCVIGGGAPAVVIAGPCSVESREQILETAASIKADGASMLRGGAYKPRTSPYDFQGLGVEGLRLLAEAREHTGLPIVTEVMDTEDVEIIAEHADMLQVGARNMQNFALLKKLAHCPRPVLLKRGPSASVKEWLLAAEYLLEGGNDQVVLCERGVKSLDQEATRNLLDIGAIALVRELSHLPVIADPSHATGRRNLVTPAARAALAAGADGIVVEVHPCPEKALSDGPQSLTLDGFARMMEELSAPMPRLAAQSARRPAVLRAAGED
jgi:3-deoxy-7-phosphoheptulonate synthase